jgi:ABC-2 type transport system permease protein
MSVLNQLRAFLRRDYLLASYSRLALTWQVFTVVLVAPTLYYLGRLIRPAASPHLAPYGGDYFAFAIVGVALFGLLAASMAAAAAAIRQEQMVGTLEVLVAAPVSLPTLAAGLSLWSVLLAAAQTFLYLTLGVVVFGIDLGRANLAGAALALLLAVATFAAVGLFAAAFVLVYRHPDPFSSIFAGLSALLGGVLYPPSVLPPVLRLLAEFVPLTHALRAIRLAVLEGAGLAALRRELLVLLLFAAVLLPLAGILFRGAVQYARRAGTLSAY